MDKKACSRCKEEKELVDYAKGRGSDGLNPWCFSCRKKYRDSYSAEIGINMRDRIAKRALLKKALEQDKIQKNIEIANSKANITEKKCAKCSLIKDICLFSTSKAGSVIRSYCNECSSKVKREWYLKNFKTENAKSKAWSKNNMSTICKRIKERRDTDPSYKLVTNIRSRLKVALSRQRADKKVTSSMGIGCSWDELKLHIESKFTKGMTWKNWGRNGWHMDHIIPLDSFDLSNPEHIIKACHYTNLQPLWAKDNLSKSNKIPNLNEVLNNELV